MNDNEFYFAVFIFVVFVIGMVILALNLPDSSDPSQNVNREDWHNGYLKEEDSLTEAFNKGTY
jgi:hypothetical protein